MRKLSPKIASVSKGGGTFVRGSLARSRRGLERNLVAGSQILTWASPSRQGIPSHVKAAGCGCFAVVSWEPSGRQGMPVPRQSVNGSTLKGAPESNMANLRTSVAIRIHELNRKIGAMGMHG